MWRWTVSPQKAPNEAEDITVEFSKGDPVKINGKALPGHELLDSIKFDWR